MRKSTDKIVIDFNFVYILISAVLYFNDISILGALYTIAPAITNSTKIVMSSLMIKAIKPR